MDTPFEMMGAEDAAARLGRGPLAAAPYADPAWFADEVAAIFRRTWLHVAHVCEVPEPGSFVRRELEFARASLLIVRGRDGAVRAFHNVCTHRGTQLVSVAGGNATKFSCPYHMWTFATDGALLSAPDFERFFVAKADCALKSVPCELVGGMVFIHLDRDPEITARDQFGALADRLDALPVAQATGFTEWTYEIGANWKTNFDNFQENYHLRFIHPRTGAQVIGEENPMGYPTAYGFSGPHRSQTLWRNPDPPPLPETLVLAGGRGARLPHDFAARFAKTDFKLFPALHVVWLSPDSNYTHTMTPLDHGRTRGSVRMYWTQPPENATRLFAREMGAMVVRDVLAEDRMAVEAGQRGLSAGVVDQVRFQDHEVLLRHLYGEVERRVLAWRQRTCGS